VLAVVRAPVAVGKARVDRDLTMWRQALDKS